ncbi:hypothetical protein Pd630_LPD16002 (plasmid) [Rhodococcus opacus PD630]|nr:hypothetical protein Pd630_LPD16002 [Rhodococcus opacus PD630]
MGELDAFGRSGRAGGVDQRQRDPTAARLPTWRRSRTTGRRRPRARRVSWCPRGARRRTPHARLRYRKSPSAVPERTAPRRSSPCSRRCPARRRSAPR